jgi:hypothetical protein
MHSMNILELLPFYFHNVIYREFSTLPEAKPQPKQHLTTLKASTACYRDSFALLFATRIILGTNKYYKHLVEIRTKENSDLTANCQLLFLDCAKTRTLPTKFSKTSQLTILRQSDQLIRTYRQKYIPN